MTDWTEKDGKPNTSHLYCAMRRNIESIIRKSGHSLLQGRADITAGIILAELAHLWELVPSEGSQKHLRQVMREEGYEGAPERILPADRPSAP